MKGKERIFPFILMGMPKAGGGHVEGLIQWAKHWEGKQIPFSVFVGEATPATH
jgi:hypothetical protein